MKTNILQAEAQFVGYTHAKKGYSLIDLVMGMGLTYSEWEDLKANYNTGLTEEETESIDKSFEI